MDDPQLKKKKKIITKKIWTTEVVSLKWLITDNNDDDDVVGIYLVYGLICIHKQNKVYLSHHFKEVLMFKP